MQNKNDNFTEFITREELHKRFRLSKNFIKKQLPPAVKINISKYTNSTIDAWPVSVVEALMQQQAFKDAYNLMRSYESDAAERAAARQKLLAASDTAYLFSTVANTNRRFVLHVGPTNSGKTHNALQSLQKADTGLYLAPLRLLALEIFDTLNQNGKPCSLLTGEENEEIPLAGITSATIEMCDFYAHYDVAVIDECQIIANEHRGELWTKAILQLDADEIHLCMAPEALDVITSLLKSINAKYSIHNYERLVPLKYAGVFKNLEDVQTGDALIAFSRKKVLSIAAELEDMGIKTSVIYGWLPPIARREEIRRFNSGESSVIVATDAIGMGVSLPIRRIIFCETQKWTNNRYQTLSHTEIKQISGRAGRYGKFDCGEVLTMLRPELVQNALQSPIAPLKYITLPFPREVINEDINLKKYIEEWDALPLNPAFKRETLKIPYSLLLTLKNNARSFSNEELFKLIKCPFNTSDVNLVNYWYECCLAVKYHYLPDLPKYNSEDLTECEIEYRSHEIRYRIAKSFGYADNFLQERLNLCLKINSLLLGSKAMFMARCKKCGKRLPVTHTGSFCPECELAEALSIKITSNGYTFTNKLADIAHFKKRGRK